MTAAKKLFLYSLSISDDQLDELDNLIGKKRKEITLGLILNATDIIENSESWVGGMTESLRSKGYTTKTIDLSKWLTSDIGLQATLADNDALWVCGGHTYYLSYILAETGADKIIQNLVRHGKVYAGWSAGAVVAVPTTKHFDEMGDDPNEVPKIILTGLNLTDKVIVPHIDNIDFEKGALLTNSKLLKDNYKTVALKDDEVYVVNGDSEKVM